MKRSIERIIFVIVALLTVGMMVSSIRFERRMTNQKLLFYQLQALRTSANLFRAIERHEPTSLKELFESDFEFPDESVRRRFVDFPFVTKDGQFLDPFGHPYEYSDKTGWIRSSTPGYEFW